jgi:Flp pilus assembly protein TadG
VSLVKSFRSLRCCRAGSTSVEFAIICTILVLVTLGAIEIGRGLNVRNQLSQAADYGARKILIDRQISDSALESEIRSAFAATAPSLLQVTIGTETVGGLQFRTVTLSYPFTLLISGVLSGVINLGLARRTPVI